MLAAAFLWPLLARAVVTDENGYYLEPGSTSGRLLVATSGALEAPVRAPERISTVSAGKPSPHLNPAVQAIIEARFGKDSIMYWVAVNESGLDPSQDNPSGAKGLFEIVGTTWRLFKCTGSPYDAYDSAACAKKIYDSNGTKDWNESKYKGFDGGWGKHLK